MKPTTVNSTATIAREIRISSRRVIQVLQGPVSAIGRGASRQSYRSRCPQGSREAGDGAGPGAGNRPDRHETQRRSRLRHGPIGGQRAPAARRADPCRHARRAAPGSCRSDQLQLERLEYGPGAITHAELGQNVRHMVLDRALGHAQGIGDLLVGETTCHQTQDLGFTLGQRVGTIQADEVVAHVFQAGEQALGHRRLHQRTTVGHGLDGADQLFQRHVLEQVALGTRLQASQHQLVVVEGGEDDRRRQRIRARQRLQSLEARHHRHAHVHQHHVGLDLWNHVHCLLAVTGFGNHLDAFCQGQQRTHALAHQGLVVHQQHTDALFTHAIAPSLAARVADAGSVSRRRNPASGWGRGWVSMLRSPPCWTRRSRMPRSPLPATSASAPRPSSRASTTMLPPSRRAWIQRLCAWACRTVLVMISWVQRSSTWARSGSSRVSGVSISMWMSMAGTFSDNGVSAAARSIAPPSRSWLTASRTSVSSNFASVWACWTCSRARPSGARWLATSRFRLSAVRWWPSRSCSSREMRVRSLTRTLSPSRARVARSSAFRRRCSSRASACWRATSAVTKTKLEKPKYSSDCRTPIMGGKSSALTNTGTVARLLAISQAMPTGSRSSQGSSPASTISRMLPRPEPEK